MPLIRWSAPVLQSQPEDIKLACIPLRIFSASCPFYRTFPVGMTYSSTGGHYPQNSEGCILVGEQRNLSAGEIFHTREMFEKLFLPIQAAVETEGAFITIVDPPNPPVILHANDL